MDNYCNICQKGDTAFDKEASTYLSLPNGITIVKCKHCGLRWLHPMKTTTEYIELYKFSYFESIPEDYEKIATERVIHYHKRLMSIKNILNKNKIHMLDVGAATGEFINEALKLGIDAVGIETSESACNKARAKYNINMIQGDFLNFDFGDKQFDVIHMHHVFEHLPDPSRSIEKIRSILHDDGLLVLEVPNQFNNVLYLVMKAIGRLKPMQFGIYSVHHPFFYTPRSLRLLFQKHNFEIEKMSTWKSYMKTKSGSFYPGATFIEDYVLMLGDLISKSGLFIEIYARKGRGRLR